jgi:hypothetical protein
VNRRQRSRAKSQEPRAKSQEKSAGGTSPNAQDPKACPALHPCPSLHPLCPSASFHRTHTEDLDQPPRSARYHRPAFFLGCLLAHAGDYWTGGPWSARYACCDAEARLCSMGPALGWVGCDGSSRDARLRFGGPTPSSIVRSLICWTLRERLVRLFRSSPYPRHDVVTASSESRGPVAQNRGH